MCRGVNFHYSHIVGDGHQPNNSGLYTIDTHYMVGWVYPQYRECTRGTFKGHSAAASCRKGQLVNDVEQVTAKLHLEEAGQKAVGCWFVEVLRLGFKIPY